MFDLFRDVFLACIFFILFDLMSIIIKDIQTYKNISEVLWKASYGFFNHCLYLNIKVQ